MTKQEFFDCCAFQFMEPDALHMGLIGYFLRKKHSEEEDISNSVIIKSPLYSFTEYTPITTEKKEHEKLCKEWNNHARQIEEPNTFFSFYIAPTENELEFTYLCEKDKYAKLAADEYYRELQNRFKPYDLNPYLMVMHRNQINHGQKQYTHFHYVFNGNFDSNSEQYEQFMDDWGDYR